MRYRRAKENLKDKWRAPELYEKAAKHLNAKAFTTKDTKEHKGKETDDLLLQAEQ
jgi:hypothetical protein